MCHLILAGILAAGGAIAVWKGNQEMYSDIVLDTAGISSGVAAVPLAGAGLAENMVLKILLTLLACGIFAGGTRLAFFLQQIGYWRWSRFGKV